MEVTIERILPGGLGLAHAEDKTILVTLAAPGDHLRVRIDRMKGNVAFASIVEVLDASAARVEPPCPYFGKCGGCDFQQLNYEAQLCAKHEIIVDCLRRIGRIESVPEFAITPAPNQWKYRSRAQWQYDSESGRLGYFESGSRRVCDVAECAVLVPELQWALEDLRVLMKKHALPSDARYFRAIVGDESPLVAAGPKGVTLATTGESDTSTAAGNLDSSTAGETREVTRTIAHESYRLSAESFFQTNVELLPQLIDEAIVDEHGEVAVELYCGVGLFTVPLARRFRSVFAVEDDSGAASFARDNLANAGLTNTQVIKSNVGEWLNGTDSAANRRTPRRGVGLQDVDLLLLDPPRTGAESRVISGILNTRPKQVCYVSCDPATLARDLKKLIGGGYSLDSITAFDMFPQTHHVETVVHLSG